MELLFRSEPSIDEVGRIVEECGEQYRQGVGRVQKFDVRGPASGHVGGVFLFESKANLAAFLASELAKSTSSAYQFIDDSQVRVGNEVHIPIPSNTHLLNSQ